MKCLLCNVILPYEKRNNKFCSQSHFATYNNTGRIRRKTPLPICALCLSPCKRSDSKYCSKICGWKAKEKYSTDKERKTARKAQVKAVTANYRAKKHNQTPDNADLEAIKKFYANCPKGYEVDHIIPISKGGLHVLENLQYLTISENRKKHNKILK